MKYLEHLLLLCTIYAAAAVATPVRPAPAFLKMTAPYSWRAQLDIIPYHLLVPADLSGTRMDNAASVAADMANLFAVANGMLPSTGTSAVAGMSLLFYSDESPTIRSTLAKQTNWILPGASNASDFATRSTAFAADLSLGYLSPILSHELILPFEMCREYIPASYISVVVPSESEYLFRWLTHGFPSARIYTDGSFSVHAVYPAPVSAGKLPVDVMCLLVDPTATPGSYLDVSESSPLWTFTGIQGYSMDGSKTLSFMRDSLKDQVGRLGLANQSYQSIRPGACEPVTGTCLPSKGPLPELGAASYDQFHTPRLLARNMTSTLILNRHSDWFFKVLRFNMHEIVPSGFARGHSVTDAAAESTLTIQLGRYNLLHHAYRQMYEPITATITIAWEIINDDMPGIADGIALLWLFVLLLRRASSRTGDFEATVMYIDPRRSTTGASTSTSEVLRNPTAHSIYPAHKTFLVFDPMIIIIAIVAFFWNVGKGTLLGPGMTNSTTMPYQIFMYSLWGVSIVIEILLIADTIDCIDRQEQPRDPKKERRPTLLTYLTWVVQKSAWNFFFGWAVSSTSASSSPPAEDADESALARQRPIVCISLITNMTLKLLGYIISAVTVMLLFSWNVQSTVSSIAVVVACASLQMYLFHHMLECLFLVILSVSTKACVGISLCVYTAITTALAVSHFVLLQIFIMEPFAALFADPHYSAEALRGILYGAWGIAAAISIVLIVRKAAAASGHTLSIL